MNSTADTRNLLKQVKGERSIALTPAHAASRLEKSVALLSDGDVLALSKVQMRPAQGRRLSALLERQREGALDEKEHPELLALMQVYDQLWIRQSEALAEAVRRGLREPIR